MTTPVFESRRLRTFAALLLAYLTLTAQLTPVAAQARKVKQVSPRAADTKPGKGGGQTAPGAGKVVLPVAPAAAGPVITATKTDNIPQATQKLPGDTINYTVTISNSGADASNVAFNDTLDPNTTLVGAPTVAPLARDDSYQTFGNTLLEVGVAASGIPAVRVTDSAKDSVFDNDTEFAGDTFTFDAVTQNPTKGTLTFNNNGTFSYQPNAGQTGNDTFKYRIKDSGGLTDEATVTITIDANEIWYVKNNVAGPGSGTSSDPYKLLSAADASSGAGDTVYVFFGDGTSTGQNAGITLDANQRLIGEGVQLDVPASINGGPNPTVLRAAGSQPSITGPNGVIVNSVAGVQIRGLKIGGTTNAVSAVFAAAGGGLIITNNTLTGGTGNAVDLMTSGTGGATVEIGDNIVTGAGAEGLDINGGGSGTLTLSLHDDNVTSTGNAIDVSRTAGNINITAFDDNTVSGNSGASGIVVNGGGGSVLFDANPATATFDAVSWGTTSVGASGNGVAAGGVSLTGVRGDLVFPELDVFADNGTALFATGTSPNYTGTSGTRLTINTGTPTLSATGGGAANITDANISLVPSTLSSTNSATSGVALTRVGGTFTAPAGSTITNATNADFLVDGGSHANANVNITYPGTITDDTGALVSITNVTAASTHTFSGAITDNFDGDGGEQGITLTGNSGLTVTFSGGLNIRTTTSPAFTATGGGTLTITDPAGGAANKLQSTTGTALTVSGTNIGAGGLTFESISSNGAANGILLNSTGTAGGLTVTGNTSGQCGGAVTVNAVGTPATVTAPDTADCTGGTIQNSTGNGISMTTVGTVSLTRVRVQNSGAHGIHMSGGTGFTLASSYVSDNTGLITHNGVNLANLSGTVSLTNSTIGPSPEHGVMMDNLSVNQTSFTLSGSVIRDTRSVQSIGAGGVATNGLGGDGLLLQMRGTSVLTSALISGTVFTNLETTGIQALTADTARIGNASGGAIVTPVASNSVTIQNSTFTSNNIAVDISQAQQSSEAFRVLSNTIIGRLTAPNATSASASSTAINTATAAGADTGPASHFHVGIIDGNVIGTQGVKDSGSGFGFGIRGVAQGQNTQTAVTISNNTIREVPNANIIALYGQNGAATTGTGSARFNVTGNVMPQPSGSNLSLCGPANTPCNDNGIFVLADEAFPICVNITGNNIYDIKSVYPNGNYDVYLAERAGPPAGAQLTVQGSGASTTYITANNTLAGVNKVIDEGGNTSTVASCGTFPPAAPDTVEVIVDEPSAPAAATSSPAGSNFAPQPFVLLPQQSAGKTAGAEVAAQSGAQQVVADGSKPGKRVGDEGVLKEMLKKGADASDPSAKTGLASPQATADTVSVNIGTLKTNDTVTIYFSATINASFTGTSVSNQGQVSGTNFTTVNTDDQDNPTSTNNDPTVTQVAPPPDITIKDASAPEPASGSSPMSFTVVLSHSHPSTTVTVNYATAAGGANQATAGASGSCGTAGVDYETTTGMLSFAPGQTVQSVSVPVCADADTSETPETFLVNLSGATAGNITDGQATGTITPTGTPGTLLISELRLSGPGAGAASEDNEFVELYNNTDAEFTFTASDASPGVGLFKSGASCTDAPVLVATIPTGTTVPARSHYLLTGSAYSLADYGGAGNGAGNQPLAAGIELDRNVAIFTTTQVANLSTATRRDAVGFGTNAGNNCDLLREGAILPGATGIGSDSEYSFLRKLETGRPADTNDNAADFAVVTTTPNGSGTGGAPVGSNSSTRFGAPGPERSNSPVNRTATVKPSFLDATLPNSAAPNRVRTGGLYNDPAAPVGSGTGDYSLGTLSIRRRFTNSTGSTVTRLRVRLVDVTTGPAAAGTADLRAITSQPVVLMNVQDPATCAAANAGNATTPCNVTAQGTTLEQPPTQANGGGYNSTLALPTPLANGDSISVQFLLGVKQGGTFRFLVIVEAAP